MLVLLIGAACLAAVAWRSAHALLFPPGVISIRPWAALGYRILLSAALWLLMVAAIVSARLLLVGR